MKKIITKEAVEKAYDGLKAQGKTTTAAALFVALGSRGSLSTITRFRDEIERERSTPRDDSESPDFLGLAKNLWAVAYQAGVAKYEPKVAELTEAMAVADRENEELEVEADGREQRLVEIEAAREQALTDLTAARAESLAARAASADQANKLIGVQDTHARETTALRERLDAQTELSHTQETRIHELELELARLGAQHTALSQQLAGVGKRLEETEKEREQARSDAATARTAASEAQAASGRAADRLAALQEQHTREMTVAQAHAAELQKEIRTADKTLATKEAHLAHALSELETQRKQPKRSDKQPG